MSKFLSLCLTLLFTNSAFASASIMEGIKSATFKTSSGLVIGIEIADDNSGLTYLTLTDEKSTSPVPKIALDNLYNISLETLEIEWGCGLITWRQPKLRESGNYCLNVSFTFGEDVEDGYDEGSDLPDWYERPQVTFTFANGAFGERTINRKESETTWSEGVE
jgi:hypothetical protein